MQTERRFGQVWLSSLRLARAAVFIAPLACAGNLFAAQPSPATTRAYHDYLRQAELRMADDYRPGGAFISEKLLTKANAAAQLGAGRALIRCVAGCESSGLPISGGLVHDWIGVVFIPGVSLPEVLHFVQDYDGAAAHYAPSVTESRLLSRSGDSFRVFLRLKQAEMVTVLFDTEYDVRYVTLDAAHVYSSSHSTRIAQLAHGSDRELPPAKNDGFLWRLDTYWRFEQVCGEEAMRGPGKRNCDGRRRATGETWSDAHQEFREGVFVECRAISLSRDIPRGLGWIVAPFLQNIPRKSLQFTLSATRTSVLAGSGRTAAEGTKSEHNATKGDRTWPSAHF